MESMTTTPARTQTSVSCLGAFLVLVVLATVSVALLGGLLYFLREVL